MADIRLGKTGGWLLTAIPMLAIIVILVVIGDWRDLWLAAIFLLPLLWYLRRRQAA